MRLLLILTLALGLAACGQGGDNRSATEMREVEGAARAMTLADPVLAEKYDRSCRGCHTVLASGAPLAGDEVSWAPRLRQGEDTLLTHTQEGVGGMPPLGMCPDCSLDEFRALIRFMAPGEGREE